MTREDSINLILDSLKPNDLVIACNGKIGRELFELRVRRGEPTNDFLCLGAMGCALGVALGVARNTEKKVVCLIGDGNFIMGLGSWATFEKLYPRNLYVYILNNDVHDSTGGQETAFPEFRRFLPHRYNFRIMDVPPGARSDLGRPTISPVEIRDNFMKKCQILN